MDIKISATTHPACIDYLKIEYEGALYSLEHFAQTYKSGEFSLDIKLKDCTLIYRGERYCYNDICKRTVQHSNSLPFSEIYREKISPIIYEICIGNQNYFKSAKLFEKAENCLQTARYYLLRCHRLLAYDYDVHWESGYLMQFGFRTMDFTTSVVWYNNCFDYILQILFTAFELYKKLPNYNESWTFQSILKSCTLNNLIYIYHENKANTEMKKLWDILGPLQKELQPINEWANYIKHKGGVKFLGLEADEPVVINIQDEDGNTIADNNFAMIELDLDESMQTLSTVHRAYLICLEQLEAFINYGAAVPKSKCSG